MKDREIITPDDEDDIADRRAAAYEREIERGDYLRDEQQDRLAEEQAMSPGEKWEAKWEASRSHIGKTKEETMNREQLVKYVRNLKSMIANLQTANAGLSAERDKAQSDADAYGSRVMDLRDVVEEIAHCDDLVIHGEDDGPEIARRLRFAVTTAEAALAPQNASVEARQQ